jgi:hypothetical protein
LVTNKGGYVGVVVCDIFIYTLPHIQQLHASLANNPLVLVQIRDLINLVQKTRYNKILQGLGMMQEAAAVKLNNLSAMELNAVRAFFTGALDQLHTYSRIGEVPDVGAGAELQTEPQQPARRLRDR